MITDQFVIITDQFVLVDSSEMGYLIIIIVNLNLWKPISGVVLEELIELMCYIIVSYYYEYCCNLCKRILKFLEQLKRFFYFSFSVLPIPDCIDGATKIVWHSRHLSNWQNYSPETGACFISDKTSNFRCDGSLNKNLLPGKNNRINSISTRVR